MPKVRPVPLSELIVDPEVNIRKKLDKGTVDHYRTILDELPPPVAFDTSEGLLLADGFHRVEATRLENFTEILVEVRKGTKQDAEHYAAIANLKHGRPLTGAERRAVVLRLKGLHPTWGEKNIARETGWAERIIKNFLLENSVRKSVQNCTDLKVAHLQEIGYAPKKHWAKLAKAAQEHNWTTPETRSAVKQVRKGDMSPLRTGIPTEVKDGQVAVNKDTIARMAKKRKESDVYGEWVRFVEKFYALAVMVERHGLSDFAQLPANERSDDLAHIDRISHVLEQIRQQLEERKLEAVR